ncbi:MAG TPA: ATP-binding protein [Tepidisphaeraceae bacterium]|jgi:serine/threonine-protein kinase RsbW|nr:ATP-binding protein [Tepidisphaeraceae bacterium]
MAVGGSKRRADGGSRQPGGKGVGSHEPPAVPNGKLAFTFFSSSLHAYHDVQKQILDAARDLGIDGENFFALRIALEEALINAMKHGNRMDPKKKVHVETHLTARRAEITVEDEGPGFDRASVPDPTDEANLHKCSGRGILLIEAYMHEVTWDRSGRRLRMIRESK